MSKLVRIATGAGVTGSSSNPTAITLNTAYNALNHELRHGEILPNHGFFFRTCSKQVQCKGLGSTITNEMGEPTDDEWTDLFKRVKHSIMFYFQHNQDSIFDVI